MRTRCLAQFLRLRAAFHTLALFCYQRKIFVRTRRVDFQCRVIFTCVKVKRDSTPLSYVLVLKIQAMVLSFKHFFAFFITVVSEKGNWRIARVVENIVYLLFSFLLLLAIPVLYLIFDLHYLLVNCKFKKFQKMGALTWREDNNAFQIQS